MSFYRSLLWWLLLATLGALAWELLAPDLGEVVLRWHGTTITTTVAFALAAWALLTFGLWMAWYLMRLPYNAWRRLAQRQARNRLLNGLTALHEGRHARAETLLAKAAQEPDARSVALLAARTAALANDDPVAAASHLAALAKHDPLAAALNSASMLLEQGKPQDALALLHVFSSPPPRGQRLRLQALAASGRAREALASLVSMPKEQGPSAHELAALELSLRHDALAQAEDADALWQLWSALPPAARNESTLILAFARRGAALGLHERVGEALVEAIDRHWNEAMVAELGQIAGRDATRQTKLESWLEAHSTSPALLLALAHSASDQQQFDKAVDYLHRAIAQGAGSEAWEQLGHAFATQGDAGSAQLAFANALRALRNETPLLPGTLGLREKIAAEAVAEQRNEHGLPLLPQ